MKWIRGGTWVEVSVEETSGMAYKACLEPMIDKGAMQAQLDARFAATCFLTKPEMWAEVIGAPAGLEVYEPTPIDALLAMEDMQRISTEFTRELQSTPLEELPPSSRRALIARLLRFLTDHGPLWPVTGLIDIGAGVPEAWEFRRVDLDALVLALDAFAEVFKAVDARPRGDGRQKLADWMKTSSEKDLREVRVVAEVTTDYGVRFEARPATLRAYLWEVLFGRNDKFPGICRYCGDEFELGQARGRPRRFCGLHRGPKYRTAVQTGRQPYRGNIVGPE